MRRFMDMSPKPVTEDAPYWNAAAGKPGKASDDRDQEQQQTDNRGGRSGGGRRG